MAFEEDFNRRMQDLIENGLHAKVEPFQIVVHESGTMDVYALVDGIHEFERTDVEVTNEAWAEVMEDLIDFCKDILRDRGAPDP
jgi:hypothetical protein